MGRMKARGEGGRCTVGRGGRRRVGGISGLGVSGGVLRMKGWGRGGYLFWRLVRGLRRGVWE